jgi:predicted Zn-dependent protease
MDMSSCRARGLFLLVPFLFVLCAAAQDTQSQQAPAVPQPPPSDVFALSPDAQKFKFTNVDLDLLKQVDALDTRISEKGLVYTDAEIEAYLERVGRSVIPPDTPEHVTWRFRVVRDPTLNAFALPNGSIYVHTGLLSRLENEAQLAGVLAHEMTHALNRHTYLQYRSMRKKAVAVHVLVAAATAAGYAGVDSAIVNAIGNLIPAAIIASMYGYSRELEHESDVYAVRLLRNAGYDPMQMARALELLTHGPEVDLSEHALFWSDHPKLEDRVRDTSALARQYGGPEGAGRSEPDAYLAGTRHAIEHDAHLAMMLGRPRTAVSIAKRLIASEPGNAAYHALLGDAYRTLGARTPEPQQEEFSNSSKGRTRKMLSKMTLFEYEKALLGEPQGKERWEANCEGSKKAFDDALQLDPKSPEAHRGLGMLHEQQGRPADAVTELKTYLELAPNARDTRQIRQRIEALEKKLTPDPQKPAKETGQ